MRSNASLASRHAEGDREAFAELMRAYAQPIYGDLARCGIPPAHLFQEVFCKVHRSIANGLPEGSVRAWLFAVAVKSGALDTVRVRLPEGPSLLEVSAPSLRRYAIEDGRVLRVASRSPTRAGGEALVIALSVLGARLFWLGLIAFAVLRFELPLPGAVGARLSVALASYRMNDGASVPARPRRRRTLAAVVGLWPRGPRSSRSRTATWPRARGEAEAAFSAAA